MTAMLHVTGAHSSDRGSYEEYIRFFIFVPQSHSDGVMMMNDGFKSWCKQQFFGEVD